MTLSNIISIFLIGISLAIILLVFFSWLSARLFCKPKRKKHIKMPNDFDLPFESVSFMSGGAKLKGWLIPTSFSIPQQPVVILCHGWSSNSSKLLPIAKTLHNSGFAVFLFDFSGHGISQSNGPVTLRQLSNDILAATNFLSRHTLVDQSRIGILGHSMGAASAIIAASNESRLRAVISTSSFADPQYIINCFTKLFKFPKPMRKLINIIMKQWVGGSFTNITPQYRIGKIRAPILLAHGSRDKVVWSKNLDVLYNHSNRNNSKKLFLPNSDHWNILSNPIFKQDLVIFFTIHLSEENASNPNVQKDYLNLADEIQFEMV